MEIELRKSCERHQHRNDKEFGVRDLKGSNDIDKIKKYFTKAVKIEIKDLEPEWSFFNDLRKVRNVIVHHNSVIKSTDNSFPSINTFKKERFLLKERSFKNNYIIELDKSDFLDEVMTNTSNLFQKLNEYKIY